MLSLLWSKDVFVDGWKGGEEKMRDLLKIQGSGCWIEKKKGRWQLHYYYLNNLILAFKWNKKINFLL